MGRNYFILAGHDSRDFGVYISGQGTFSAPQKDLEFIAVPGRNGELLSDQKRFENLELTYRAFIYTNFDASIAAFRAFLLSLSGYQRLTDSYHPDEFRMVAYQGAFEPTVTKKNDAGSFDIKFICKPQRFLLSGENAVSLSSSMASTDTYTGKFLTFNASEISRITKLETEMPIVQNNNGYSSQWAGGAGKNLFDKDNANVGNFYMNATTPQFVSSNNTRTIYIPCEPNTTYTVSKTAGVRFAIAYSADVPAAGVTVGGAVADNTGSSLTITTNATAAYLSAFVWYTTDSITLNAMLASIQIEKGPTATSWTPYQNVATFTAYTSANLINTGKNLIVPGAMTAWSETTNNVTFEFNYANHVKMSGQASAQVSSNTMYFLPSGTAVFLKLSQGDTLTMKISGKCNVNGTLRLFWRRNTTSISGLYADFDNGVASVTASGDVEVNSFYFRVSQNSVVDVDGDIQIEVSSTATEYEEPKGKTYSGDWSSSVGTLYHAVMDAVAKTVTTRYAAVRFSDMNWTKYGSYQTSFTNTAGDITDNKLEVAPICSTYVCPDWGATAPNLNNGEIIFGVATGSAQRRLFLRDDRFTTVEAFLQAMGDTLVIYELETPATSAITMDTFAKIEGKNHALGRGESMTAEVVTPATLTNPTRFPSKPLLKVPATGTLVVNNTTITITEAPVTIDCEMMDCYYGATNMNNKVTFSNYEFPELEPGANGFSFSGNVNSVQITPRWWTV